MQAMVTGWFFLTGLLLRPQLRGLGFVLRGFFKMVGAAPQTPRDSSSRLVFDESARALGLISVLLVFCGVRAVDGVRCSMFYFLIILIYINMLLYFFMS